MKVRCNWAENGTPMDVEYHDNEWAVPVHDDKKLYEFLLLESAQAGLSWSTGPRKEKDIEEHLTILIFRRLPLMITQNLNNFLQIHQ